MENENLPNINANLDLKVTDFLLLQEISEMKLNRTLGKDQNQNDVRFYDNYKNKSFIDDEDYKNQFYTAVGSKTNLLNNNPLIESVGGAGAYTKIPKEQADYFLDNYDIVDYYGNDNTGFSATTFKNKHTSEITISCRSTEYKEDYYKDAYGADQEISNNGTAIAQNISLVNYLEHLKSLKTVSNGKQVGLLETSKLNITGYSLGGHLASSAYQYLKSEGYSNLQLYVFNGPGVGNVSAPNNISNTTTENFGYLKQDLLNYTNIINMFEILKVQNIDNEDDAKNFVDQNSNNQLTKDFFHSFSSIKYLSDLIKKNLNNTLLNTSRLNFYDIKTNSYIAHENELEKNSHISQNYTDSYLETTIYGNDLYQAFQDYIKFKYHLSKAGIGGDNNVNTSTFETLIQAAQSEKTGIQDNFLFGPNALWINGQSTVNNYDFLSNDFNFVANSNRYANAVDIVIEDRPETEDGISRVPVINSISHALNGDFGNTHSITLLNKSLNLMATLAKLEGKNSIDVAKYSSIISSASKERATHFYLSEDGSNGTGDSNAISNVINTLSDLLLSKQEKQLIPFDTNINFDNSLGGWADINKIEQLSLIEKKLINKTSNIKLVSFYNIKNEDLSRSQFNQTSYEYIKKEDLIQKAKTNIAYRYALDKLNTFAIEDADYSNYKDSEHSDEWYSSRANVLLRIIDSNVENLNNYVSSNYTDGKPTKTFTNIYVNDSQQDLHFYSSAENKNVNYKTYNENSYYYKSQKFNTISSLDNSLLNTLLKIKDYYISPSDHQALITAASTFSKVVFARALPYPYIAYKGYNMIKNFSTSIDVFNYFSDSIIDKITHKLIGNMTNRQSLPIGKNIYFLDNSTSNYTSDNYKNKNENIFINVNKDLLFSYLKGERTFENKYFEDTKSELRNGLSKPNIVDDIKLTHDITLGDGKDYIEIKDDGVANIISKSGEKNYNLNGDFTLITDPDKKGTITLDGIVLDGGEFIFENDKISSYKTQKYSMKNNNGTTINSSIKYEVKNFTDNSGSSYQGLLITNDLTNHKVFINGMYNYGSTYTFHFKEGEKPIQTITTSLEKNDFSKEETNTINLNPTYQEQYTENDNLDAIFNINVDITNSNIVLNRLPNSKTDLFIYDKTNTSKNYTIKNYFDNNGSIIDHQFLLEHTNNNQSTYTTETRRVKINNTYFSDLSVINKTSIHMFEPINDENMINQGYSLYELDFSKNNEFYYSKNSKFFLNSSLLSNLTISKSDNNNDLILSKNDPLVNSNTYKTVIKNYFLFNHENDSNFYFHSNSTNENKQASIDDLLKINTLKLDDTGVQVQLNTNPNTTSSVISGLGNDKIIGTSSNERFISSSKLMSYDTINSLVSDGNDQFISGGGADEFIFNYNFGYDVINGFNNNSRVIINMSSYESTYQFGKNNDDLLIYKEYNPLNSVLDDQYSTITIKDYFKNIDYLTDSRIIFNRDNNSQQDYFANNSLLSSNNYQFNSNEISYFNTTKIDDDNDLFEQNKKDTSDTSIDNTKLHTSYISGNDLDNTIIIRNNDTIIKPNQTSELTDGDDTYIIDIAATEALNPNHNVYRTTIQFGYNSGHDSLFNPTFKETNQYGDIIELVNIDSQSITINKIQDDSNVLVGFNVILSDGSSIALTLNDLSNQNVDVIKTSDKVIKLSELLTMASPNVISGDSLNNSFDFSSLDKSVNVKGMDGNDLIKGSKADDLIEGDTGFDQYQFSGGFDTYVFKQNCDIDTFNTDTIPNSDLNNFGANFLIDSSFKNTIKYLFNEKENEAYLKFSDSDGVVFTNMTWGKFINIINNINIKFTDNTTMSINVSDTESFPFMKTAKIINGTNNSEYLQTSNINSSVVYAKEGNDTIVSNGASYNTRNFIFGGEGNDTITANDGDIVVVKDGDGSDTIKTSDRSFVLEILHNTPRLVNGQEVLFDLSASSTSDDLVINYGNSSSDNIIIQDYFESNDNEISFVIYDEVTDKSFVFNDLKTILSSLNINKSSLINQSSITVYKTAVTADMIGNTGQLLGGELTAQYLAGNYLQDANKISHIIDNQLNGQPLQNKVYQ